MRQRPWRSIYLRYQVSTKPVVNRKKNLLEYLCLFETINCHCPRRRWSTYRRYHWHWWSTYRWYQGDRSSTLSWEFHREFYKTFKMPPLRVGAWRQKMSAKKSRDTVLKIFFKINCVLLVAHVTTNQFCYLKSVLNNTLCNIRISNIVSSCIFFCDYCCHSCRPDPGVSRGGLSLGAGVRGGGRSEGGHPGCFHFHQGRAKQRALLHHACVVKRLF